MNPYKFFATVRRVVDGDTLDLQIDLGFRILTDQRVRLKGVDTPEVYGVKKGTEEYEQGKEATEFTESWVAQHGPVLVIETHMGTGKYGRWLAEIYSEDMQHNLGQDLLEAGMATLYS